MSIYRLPPGGRSIVWDAKATKTAKHKSEGTYKFAAFLKQEESDMRIILDGMGGDHAPASVVEGAILAMKEMEHEIVIVGQQELIVA